MLSNLFTNTTNTWLFYTAVGANAIGMALVTEATGKSISWTGWLQATFIPAGLILLFIPWFCHKLYGSKGSGPPHRRYHLRQGEAGLHGQDVLQGEEGGALLYPHAHSLLHQRPARRCAGYIVFVTVFLMLCPGIGVCSFKEVNKTFAWPAFLQLGFAMSLANCVSDVGGFQWVVDMLFVGNSVFTSMNITTFLIIWLTFVVALHVIFAGMNAMEAVIVPVSMTLAAAMDFDVYTMGLLTVMAISAGAFFLPFNSAPNLIFYSTDRFTTAQELKGAIPLAILIVIGLIFSVLVWFPIIGIL